uniref:OVOS protein n=1 Tax=Rodentolepis nana TaxID=102285 RepID=A0A0R3TZ88_RODNA
LCALIHLSSCPCSSGISTAMDRGYNFDYSFECPLEVAVNQLFSCSLAVNRGQQLIATVQFEGQAPLNFIFKENMIFPLALHSLRSFKNQFIPCSGAMSMTYTFNSFPEGKIIRIVIANNHQDVRFDVQIDIELPRVQFFYGSFDQEGNYSVRAILDSYVGEKIAATRLTEVRVAVSALKSTPIPTLKQEPPKITATSVLAVESGGYVSGCGEHYNVFANDTALYFNFKVEGNVMKIRYRFTQYSDPNQFYQEEVQNGAYQFQAKLARGLYVLSATISGPDGESTEAHRIFEIEDPTDHAMICKRFDQNQNASFTIFPSFSKPSLKAVGFRIFNESGRFHFVKWMKQDVCFSPEVIPHPEIPSIVTANVDSFIVKVICLEDGKSFEILAAGKRVCLPKAELNTNYLYTLIIYGSNKRYIHRDRHNILVANESAMNVVINSVISSPEETVLTGTCNQVICSRNRISQWELTMSYPKFTFWKLSDEEMQNYTDGRTRSTLIISPQLLLQLPRGTYLLACLIIQETVSIKIKVCEQYTVSMAKKCDSCYLNASNMIDDFQKVCVNCSCTSSQGDTFEFYTMTNSGTQSIAFGDRPLFCSYLPASDDAVTPCIRSLPGSMVNIRKCFHQIKLTDKLVEAIEGISLAQNESLLPLTSALEALANTSKDMSYYTVNRLGAKLKNLTPVLKQILSLSSRDDIFLISQRLMQFQLLLTQGMSLQYKDPLPSLKDRELKTLDYDTDIDSDQIATGGTLISKSIKDDQRESAKSMAATFEYLNQALATVLHEVLISGGSALEIASNTAGTVSFCRVDSSDIEDKQNSCGFLTSFFFKLPSNGNQSDFLIRTSNTSSDVYNFFGDAHEGPQSDLLSFSVYSKLNDQKGNLSIILQHLSKRVSESNGYVNDAEQLYLADPLVAIDGSLIHQSLIMHSYEVDDTENTGFVFQLEPNEISSCPQYLVIARFVIPPNLRQLDHFGQFFWTMLPTSISKCNSSKSEEEALLDYALYMQSIQLTKLKSDAFRRTKHMRLKASEVNRLYIGYRELTVEEHDLYNEMNPPPIPYHLTNQINTTAHVSVGN